jgi:beta-lactamase class A
MILAAVAVLVVAVASLVVIRPVSASRSSAANAWTARLTAQVQQLVTAAAPVQVAISAVDIGDGRTFDFGPTSGLVAASVSKLLILEALLMSREKAHAPLTEDQDALATAMIEHSDNDEGQTLWDELGAAPGLSTAETALSLGQTVADPDGYYGLTTTSPEDQVQLLRNLVDAPGPLDAASQAYALNLLRNVDSDQAWGVTSAADAGSVSAVKNGWLAIDSDGDRWAVNSDGIITVGGRRLLLSIMTQHGPSEQAGIALIESLAKLVAPTVG